MPIPVTVTNPLQPHVDTLDEQSTAQQTVAAQNEPKVPPKPAVDVKTKKRNTEFRSHIDICKIYRRKLISNWTINVDYRRGKPFTSQTDEDQVAVNLDWSMTKAKQAALFSQVPQARLLHSPDTLPKSAPWCSTYERKLNDTLIVAGIESAMDECLPDCINAAGIGSVLVSYESITEDREVPSNPDDPESPLVSVPFPVDRRYVVQRLSPADLLWPVNFTGSNFDQASWIGRSGRVTWAEALQKFKSLTEADKATVLGEDRPMLDRLTHDVERDKSQADELVGFDEIFFKEHHYDEGAKSFNTIHHLVFVSGKDDPVIDEAWKGQKINDEGTILGAQRYPIQVLTFTYITDETIPPSDSAIGRPQVNEINKARTQMIRQRERSLPVRWIDINRIDPAILQSLMRGTWQAFIPVQGDGARSIGEVTRASMPQENFLFDKIAKADLQEEWTVGMSPQQLEEAKGDPNQNKQSFNTQAGRDRAKVASFFCRIAEVLGGLMCLYEDPSTLGQGFDPAVSQHLKFMVFADSTVLLDANQKLARLNQFVETYAKSGWVNLEPVLQEIAILTGLDPSLVIQPPSPKPPVEPNISLRLTGVEDMLNPLALATLIKSGQAPDQDLIAKAKELIQIAVTPPEGMQGPAYQKPGGFPMLPGGQPPSPSGQTPGGAPTPEPPPPAVGEAHPQLTPITNIGKRTESGGKQ